MSLRKIVDVFVRGLPKGQPRARASAVKGKDGKWRAHVHDPGTAEGWKSMVILGLNGWRPASPIEGPIQLLMAFVLKRPASLSRKKDPEGRFPHTKKPDLDNLQKAVMDAMTQDGWWNDDSQVQSIIANKSWAAKGEAPGMQIAVLELV